MKDFFYHEEHEEHEDYLIFVLFVFFVVNPLTGIIVGHSLAV